MIKKQALALVLPEAYKYGTTILSKLNENGFAVVKSKSVRFTKGQAHRILHPGYKKDPKFNDKIHHLTSDLVGCIVLNRTDDKDCIEELNKLAGPEDPEEAKRTHPQSLRALCGLDLIRNAVYISQDYNSADREIETCFPTKRRTIVLFGPPAAGKGTQSELLSETYNLVHISTGDLLRDHVRRGTDIGKEVKRFLDKGELVPDGLITKMALDRLKQPDCVNQGWVLDGFPRTAGQAQSIIDAGVDISLTIKLEASAENLIARVTGRRFDPQTGQIYHIVWRPPPPEIAKRCIQRSDDTEEIMRNRLKIYNATIEAVSHDFREIQPVYCTENCTAWDVFHQVIDCVEPAADRNIGTRKKSTLQRDRLKSNL